MIFMRDLPQALGLTSAALGALLIGAASISCAHADGLPNPFANFIQPNNNSDAIDYRPRPMLVVPPTNDLPPPQSSSSSLRGANWPKDPDQNAMHAAKADSRQPAPSTERLVSGDTNQKIFVRDDGPDCEPFLGMQIMCFKAPWGGDVQLPGATQSKDPKGVVVTSQPRKYLSDPPAQYLAAVQPQAGSDAADNAAPPRPSCATPGWFGCPEQAYVPNPNSQAGVATNGQAPQPEQQCMFPGHFGCPALPPKPQASQAAAGPPAPGQPAPQPKPNCLPGWFGCPDQ
jgi:hypothetical protein